METEFMREKIKGWRTDPGRSNLRILGVLEKEKGTDGGEPVIK